MLMKICSWREKDKYLKTLEMANRQCAEFFKFLLLAETETVKLLPFFHISNESKQCWGGSCPDVDGAARTVLMFEKKLQVRFSEIAFSIHLHASDCTVEQ